MEPNGGQKLKYGDGDKIRGERSPTAINIQEWAAGTVLAPRSWEGTDYCRKILAASIGCTFVTGAKLT